MKVKRKTFIRFVLLFWLFLMAAIWAGLKYISYEVEDLIAVKQKIIVEPTKTDEKEESMEMETEWEEYEELPDYSYLHEQVPDAIAYLMIPNTEIAYPLCMLRMIFTLPMVQTERKTETEQSICPVPISRIGQIL